MCIYPTKVKNPKYLPNKKNGGVIPPFWDERVLYVPVGCGKCTECRKQRTNQWRYRLEYEIKNKKNENVEFVTMTFSEESIKKIKNICKTNEENEIAKIAIRKYLERWRKKNKKSQKHWLITELGHEGTERIHIHGLIWCDKNKKKEIEKTWGYGWIGWGKYVNSRTINYILKYVTKIDTDHPNFNGKIFCSPGLGKGWVKENKEKIKYKKDESQEFVKLANGKKINMPMYYKQKIYTEDEREHIWIEKLNKNITYINGREINSNETALIAELRNEAIKNEIKITKRDIKSENLKKYKKNGLKAEGVPSEGE